MKKATEDRRVRRTQKLLKESLAGLMNEKEFKDITIKDITERADLNRGTFYLHYADTYELLTAMEDDVLADFQDMINAYLNVDSYMDLMPVLCPVVHYIVENEEICRNLFENDASSRFHNKFRNLIHSNGKVIIERLFAVPASSSIDYYFEFVTSGLIGLINRWLRNGMPESETEIARIGNNALLAAIAAFINPAQK